MTAPAHNPVADPAPAASRVWSPEPPTVRGWLTHHSRNPLAALLFLAAFAFIAWQLPKSPPDDSLTIRWTTRGYRWVEAHWNSARPKPPVNIGPRRDFAWVYLRVEGGRVFDLPLEDVSYEQQRQLLDKYPNAHFFKVGYVHEVHRKGVWYPWLERWQVTVKTELILRSATPPTDGVMQLATEGAAERVPGGPRVRQAVAAGGATGHRIVPQRILINLTSIVLVVLIVRGVVTHRAWRGQRRWRRGVCPGCSYSTGTVRAVDGRRTCPECGVSAPVVESRVQERSR
ncbi:MAG TPA: hypothetical protein VHN77_09610 [Phycisphaerales bacterium]|nr:hypothetical protein [Phycisphaerales bacterium]